MLLQVTFIVVFSCLIFSTEAGAPDMESTKYEEPKCVEGLVPAPNMKGSWISKVAAWYIPMASAYVYHSWVEKLTNKSSAPEYIPNLCLKLLFLASSKPNTPYMVVAGGLNKAVGYKCQTKGPHDHVCNGIVGSPQFQPGVEVEEVAVQTDNQHYVLMVQCVRNTLKAWYVMTPSTDDLSQDVKKEALNTAVKLGFDRKFGSMITYEKCPKSKA